MSERNNRSGATFRWRNDWTGNQPALSLWRFERWPGGFELVARVKQINLFRFEINRHDEDLQMYARLAGFGFTLMARKKGSNHGRN